MEDWSQLVKQYGSIVWKTVYRLVNNEADAADCFQNTFVAAWKIRQSEKVENWPGLLRRIASARALDRLRQRYRDTGRCVGLPEEEPTDAKAFDPSRTAESVEIASNLRNAIANLEAQQAQAVCLAYLEGFTYQEVAKSMGVTVSHVGVLLNRARTSLRERLVAAE